MSITNESLPLEDNWDDILAKAQRGLELDDTTLAGKIDISVSRYRDFRNGMLERDILIAVAPHLGLHPERWWQIASGTWRPLPQHIDGLRAFTTPFSDFTVNAYLLFDPLTKAAACVDTGTDAQPLIDAIDSLDLGVERIFLTHSHRDHIAELQRLRSATGNPPVSISDREPIAGTEPFARHSSFRIGKLHISTLPTAGHSPGGTTYFVEGLEKPLALCGDALFAGSMGGGLTSYCQALRTNQRYLYPLPEQTVLCPGHGPMSTIAEEKAHNPFFP